HSGIAIAILLVTGAGFSVYSPKTQMVPLRKRLRDFPTEFAGYNWEFQPLSEEMEKAVGADEYLNLVYGKTVYKSGRAYYEPRASVYATYNGKGAGQIPHVPWVCMEAGGYKKLGEAQTEVRIPRLEGQAVPASALKQRPWMCLVSVGPTLFISSPTKGIPLNLLEFEHPGTGKRALMFQYFNVGGYYTPSRQVARFQAWWQRSYLAQVQISVWLTDEEAMRLPPLGSRSGTSGTVRESRAYEELMQLLKFVAPELEKHLPKSDGRQKTEDGKQTSDLRPPTSDFRPPTEAG
ncbi:unnamed protein product, partial [marine sediment metagenome]